MTIINQIHDKAIFNAILPALAGHVKLIFVNHCYKLSLSAASLPCRYANDDVPRRGDAVQQWKGGGWSPRHVRQI
ncbi:MAG TPA: hypothetical protein VE597_07735, partial [Geminicoccaceae bacterium]|nr:hypothetical protein [Geminicoccaceae bacterium]